jgi:hypothetical protein
VRSEDAGTGILHVFIQMESALEPLAHSETLSDLNVDLIRGQGLEENESDGNVEAEGVHNSGGNAGAALLGEVALLDEEHVGAGEKSSGESGVFPDTLGVVKAVNNGSVLLPLVGVHA